MRVVWPAASACWRSRPTGSTGRVWGSPPTSERTCWAARPARSAFGYRPRRLSAPGIRADVGEIAISASRCGGRSALARAKTSLSPHRGGRSPHRAGRSLARSAAALGIPARAVPQGRRRLQSADRCVPLDLFRTGVWSDLPGLCLPLRNGAILADELNLTRTPLPTREGRGGFGDVVSASGAVAIAAIPCAGPLAGSHSGAAGCGSGLLSGLGDSSATLPSSEYRNLAHVPYHRGAVLSADSPRQL